MEGNSYIEEFLLYQAITVRTMNVLRVLYNNTRSSLKKNNEVTFYMVGYDARVIDFTLSLSLMIKTALYAQCLCLITVHAYGLNMINLVSLLPYKMAARFRSCDIFDKIKYHAC